MYLHLAGLSTNASARCFTAVSMQKPRQRRQCHQGTVPDPAHRAGLRDGETHQTVVAKSAMPKSKSRYDVMDGGAAKTLAWLPVGGGVEKLREFKVDPSLAGDAR